MAFKYTNEEILRLIPEDIKRQLKREIEKCKTNSPILHYQYAYHLITKFESVMDIFVASESSKSEIEELKTACAFCLNAIDDEQNYVWICQDCKKILGVFKNTLSGLSENDFVGYLLALLDNCRSCGGGRRVLMKSGFLASGVTLEKAMGTPPPAEDTEAKTWEALWITIRMNYDLKTSIKTMTDMKGYNLLKNLLKEGRIQNLIMTNKEDGDSWTLFGKLAPEDKQKYRITDTASINKSIQEGVKFIEQKRYKEAIQSFDSVLEHRPNASVLALKGMALEGLDKNEEALLCYDMSLEIDPKNASVWKTKAYLLHNMNRYEEAIECFFMMPEIDLSAIHRTVNKLMELKRFGEVVKCYDKIILVNDKDPQSWNNKGFVLYNCLHKHDEAIVCLKKAADLGHAGAMESLKALGLR